jgi:hypothetical protein
MAQTPISASTFYSTSTPTTIYTVPATRTAVVKTVMASSWLGVYDTVTLNKVSGGVLYTLVKSQRTGNSSNDNTTYFPPNAGNQAINLLSGPITLSAGDYISISTTSTPQYFISDSINNTNYLVNNINYLNGYYIAVGFDNGLSKGLVLTSTDGITWTKQTFPDAVTLTDVAYGGGTYVVCNSSTTAGTVHYSTNLTSWTSASLPSFASGYGLYCATYGGGNFVIGGAGGYSYYSSNGSTWTQATRSSVTADINSIIYVGTNYLYCPSGSGNSAYYTSNFTAYTYPYIITFAYYLSRNGSVVASNSLLLATTTQAPGNGATQNVYYTSTDGNTWTVGVLGSSGSFGYSFSSQMIPILLYSGYYFLFCSSNSGISGAYLYSNSAANNSWSLNNATWTGYNSGGLTYFTALYEKYNSTYGNLVSVYQSSSYYMNIFTMNSSGGYQNQQLNYTLSNVSGGDMYLSVAPIMVGNPFDGTWIAVGYYGSGAAYGAPFYAGSDRFNQTFYGYAWNVNTYYSSGYGSAAGAVPNSNKYLLGSSTGFLFLLNSYTAQFNPPYFGAYGTYAYYTSGLNAAFWNTIGGSTPVAFIGRSGDASNSMLLVVWENGQCAVSTDQATTWTTGSIGMSSIAGGYDMRYGTKSVSYGNGKWWATNPNQSAYSTDGINWTTMISNIDSTYTLNNQNVYITGNGIYTSPTNSLTFTQKTNTSYTGNPSVRKLTYVGSTYYLGFTGLYSSSDLTNWTTYSYGSNASNGTSWYYGTYSGLTYSGTGSNIIIANAKRNSTSSNVQGLISNLFSPTATTVLLSGSVTAGIVEIS